MTRGEAGVQPEGTLAITKSVTADLHASTNSGRANPRKGRPRGARPAPDLVAALLQPVTIRMQGKERKVSFPEAMIQVAKDKALKGDQRAAQTLINLMRELDILKPQEVLSPPEIHIHFGGPEE